MEKGKIEKKYGSGLIKRKKRALGKGIDALIPDIGSITESPKEYFQCDIELIRPNRYQPRLRFSKDELNELCLSIKEQGIIQPLLIRGDGSGYELVAGERRLRAAKMAGLRQVPVVIKNITDSELLEISIVENIQREDLNPMEEADAYQNLINEFKLTQNQISERVGKSRSAVANFLRLRHLPEQIRADIREGNLSMGHARALLGAETSALQNKVWQSVVSKRLSVRQTEILVKRLKTEKKKSATPSKDMEKAYFSDLADKLSLCFGTRVLIKRHGKKGKLEFDFYSDDDLDRLINLLKQ